LEGIIAKRSGSTYDAGARSRQWLKVKEQITQDGVIAGFTAPVGGRNHFGSLVLGVFEGGALTSIGSVGSGFTERDLAQIRAALDPLIQNECPLSVLPETNAPVTWVRPVLVVEVGLSGWTGDAVMRHPVFLRLREDKAARDVVRETPPAGGEGGS
jgi:bifunctional non-homologous end joining protein LigD